LLLFGSIVLTFFILEVGIRATYPIGSLANTDDQEIGWRYLPNMDSYRGWTLDGEKMRTDFYTNDIGFRDDYHEVEKPDDTKRIAFLGDSFVSALQVPFTETFHEQLEGKLNESIGNFETMNFAANGYGTGQELIILRDIVKDYSPDQVVLTVYLGNDVCNNTQCDTDFRKPYFTLEDGKLKQHPGKVRDKHIIKDTLLKSHLVRYTFQLITQNQNGKLFNILVKLKVFSDPFEGGPKAFFKQDEIFVVDYSDEVNEAWDLTKAEMREIKKITDSMGAELTLLIIPHIISVHGDLWDEYLIEFPALEDFGVDSQKPIKVMEEFCEAESLNCIQLAEHFAGITKENSYYLIKDGHFNERGHDKVTEVLLDYFKKAYSAQ